MKKTVFILLCQAFIWAGLVLYFGCLLRGTGVFPKILGPLGAGISITLILSGFIAKHGSFNKEGKE